MSQAVSNKWFWITVLSVVLILVIPLAVVLFVLTIPPDARIIATITIIVAWGVVSGYKDWVISKRREAQKA